MPVRTSIISAAKPSGDPRVLVKEKGWEVQSYLAEEEKKFGNVGEHQGPEIPISYSEENGVQLPAHPILKNSVQHSGVHKPQSSIASDNPETKDELVAELQNQLQNQPQLANKLGMSLTQKIKAYNNEKKYQNSFTSTPTLRLN